MSQTIMEQQKAARRGICLVIAAPSGAGKSTILRALLARDATLVASVSATTRVPRASEIDGTHYHFRTPAQFDQMVEAGELLEYARVFGRAYGTPRAPVEAWLHTGRDVLLDIDWQGWRQLRAALPGDCVGVFILPPSIAALEERLHARGSDKPEEVSRRMNEARAEISHWREFNHVLVNEDLERCTAQVEAILTASRSTVARNLAAGRLAEAMIR